MTSILARPRIAPRLEAIRARGGVEFGVEEQHAGVGTAACPLIGWNGMALGALVVAGLGIEPDLRLDSTLIKELIRSAQAINNILRNP